VKILVIGDSCIDVFIYGEVARLAPAAPVPVIIADHKTENLGMAANVAANLKALGIEAALITNSNPIKKIRYVDSRYNQMLLRVDEEDCCKRIEFGSNNFSGFDAIIISDYCKGFLEEEDIQKIIENAECTVFLDTKKQLGPWCNGVDFIKINNYEFEANKKVIEENEALKNKLIVTKGKYGCEFRGTLYPTQEVPVKDVSGAGDTFIAALTTEFCRSRNIIEAINFAQICTTEVVQKKGVATI